MVTSPSTNPENCGGTTNATCYRISFYAFQVVQGVICGGTSSVEAQVTFQDPASSAASALAVADFAFVGNGSQNTPISPNSSGSGATLVVSASGGYAFRAKVSTQVKYQTTVTPGTGCTTAPTYWISRS